MHTTTPEIWALKVFFRLVAKQFTDVLAYEGRSVITGSFKGIYNRW
jgi:hypothetical protein